MNKKAKTYHSFSARSECSSGVCARDCGQHQKRCFQLIQAIRKEKTSPDPAVIVPEIVNLPKLGRLQLNLRELLVMYLWPFIDQGPLAAQNDVTQHFYVAPGTIAGTMNGVCGARIALYNCPADNNSQDQDAAGTTYMRTRGNYLVNWGAVDYDTAPPVSGSAPFAHLGGNRSTPRITKMVHFYDGTSNTLLMAEYLKPLSGADNDWRADFHNDDGVFRFHTKNTPNSTVPDQVGWAQPNGDPLMPILATTPQHNAARSRHPGGIHALLGDGTVRWIANNISLTTWQALGTMDGNEVASVE